MLPPRAVFRVAMQNTHLLGPWRRSFQWVATLVMLLLPWGRLDGRSLLRIDITTLSLHLFGTTLRIEELYLLLFFSLAVVLFFLLATLVFGRVWCGWACPQTTLNDLAEWTARRLKLNIDGYRLRGSLPAKILLHLFLALLALLVGSNLLWYFIEPRLYLRQLFSAQLHPVAVVTLVLVAVAVYLDLVFLRRLICRDFCPYGRFQTVLVDRGTLTLLLPQSEAARCIECGGCVRSCPMEIDIRQGYQIECINCGRCLDACRQVMAKRREPGLIGYYFGATGEGFRALLNPRTLLLASGLCAVTVLLVFAVATRPQATLKIAQSHQVASRRLSDGSQANFLNAWINNRTTHSSSYALAAQDSVSGAEFELKGPTRRIALEPGQNHKVDFVLVTPFTGKERKVAIILKDSDGSALDRSVVRITPHKGK